MKIKLFDTHTHFDVPEFDVDRQILAEQAKKRGVEALILIGFLRERFADLVETHQWLNTQGETVPKSYLAPGLHPFYIEQHEKNDLYLLEQLLNTHDCVAIGEIGLDTFLKQHKVTAVYEKQKDYFLQQLLLAEQFDKPVLLHIRKSHAAVLQQLKKVKFKQGGIAHAFSGGVEEAKAFIKLGFKIGVTGQVTNLNARKLHQVIQAVGYENLVIETDCPDMTPLCCQVSNTTRTRNTPENLYYVLEGLAEALNMNQRILAEKLWENSMQVLRIKAS